MLTYSYKITNRRAVRKEETDMNNDLHEMYLKLIEMGATPEDIEELYKIALETADQIINQ